MSKRQSDEAMLAGKVVLVTGGSRGIGRAIALACATAGADVALTYRTGQREADDVAAAVRALGRRAAVLPADVTRPEEVVRLAAGARSAFGRVDVWINNAGADVLTGRTAGRSRLEKLDLLLAVDLRGTVLARTVAPEIRVNVLGPGWVETAYGSELDPATKQRITATVPLGRWGTPEDIAYAAVYLASDGAAYVTGQMLMINGGGVM